jgi:hypothetical protein
MWVNEFLEIILLFIFFFWKECEGDDYISLRGNEETGWKRVN